MAFRWCRFCGWTLLLLLLLGVFYLHQVGLPDALRAMVLSALRDHGLDVQCRRLRLHWYHGLVADDVRIRLGRPLGAPEIEFGEVVVNLQWRALWRQELQVQTVDLRAGRLQLPLAATNEPPENLDLQGIGARLRFDPGGAWNLEGLSLQAFGTTVSGYGVISNAATWARWRPTSTADRAAAAGVEQLWKQHLRRLQRRVQSLRFVSPPELALFFSGDARDPTSFRLELQGKMAGVVTPWGRLGGLQLRVKVSPDESGQALERADLEIRLAAAHSPWGQLRSGKFHAVIHQPFTNTLPVGVDWDLQAAEFLSPAVSLRQTQAKGQSLRRDDRPGTCLTTFHVSADRLDTPCGTCAVTSLDGQAVHSLTNWVPRELEGRIAVTGLSVRDVRAASATADVHLTSIGPLPQARDPGLGFWARLAPVAAAFSVGATNVQAPQGTLDTARFGGRWRFPDLTVTNLHAALCGGTLDADRLALDIATREAAVALTVDFDIQRLDHALPPSALAWLSHFSYRQPPHVQATASVRLPPWLGTDADAGRHLLESLDLRARIDGQDAAYHVLPADQAGVTLTISNQVLRLRDLALVRPEGRADLRYDLDLNSRDFRWSFACQVDPQAAAPVIDPALPDIIRLFAFTAPPVVSGEVWGNWVPPKKVEFALQLAATNFTFRSEHFDTLTAGLQMTNHVLSATEVEVRTGGEEVHAPWVTYDPDDRLITLTNARAHMDPQRIARCIGTNVERLLAPYQFAAPPDVLVQGRVPAGSNLAAANLTLDVAGGPFRFWRFNTPQVTTRVRWTGDRVSVTNLTCAFYAGRLVGGIDLELLAGGDARFALQAQATDADLQHLLADVAGSTNRIEGTVTASLIVTNAFTGDWKSWFGHGRAEMHNGLLWDLPIFGTLSHFVNVFVPGIGNSRARAATATYTITRSVIRTDDLAIEAGPARLLYRGTVDFDGNVAARVVAEVLHSTPIIGPLISLALSPAAKALEFKVSGTLDKPVLKPVYVPPFLLPFLNPIGTLKDIVTPAATKPPANNPPRSETP